MSYETCGIALTFYPFCWKVGYWKLDKVWMAQLGPFGFVLSLQRQSKWMKL